MNAPALWLLVSLLVAADPAPPAAAPVEAPAPQISKGEVARAVDEYLEARPPVRERTPLEIALEKLVLYGDLRLRHESAFNQDDKDDRDRQRIRMRLGANYQIHDELLVGGRIITGDRTDPRSPHVTLGDGFDSFEISLDRAFAQYRPEWLPDSVLTLGKFAHSFASNPVYGETVWDADVQPEGALAQYTMREVGPLSRVDFRAGAYIMIEQGGGDEAWAGVAQASTQFDLGRGVDGMLAVGYYDFGDTSPDGSSRIFGENDGNATVDRDGDGTPDDFLSDFRIVNPIASVTIADSDFPVSVSGEYIKNTAARNDEDEGFAAGVSVGKTRDRGDWRLYYQWQRVEQDAVLSYVAADDFLFPSNYRGHVFGVNYQWMEKVGLHLWALASERLETSATPTTDSDDDQWRVRFDINIRF